MAKAVNTASAVAGKDQSVGTAGLPAVFGSAVTITTQTTLNATFGTTGASG